jgi:HTH-type transcriptional regulator/antitoxin HigA
MAQTNRQESHLKVIKTEAEYSAAIERFEALLGAKPGQPGYHERDVLAVPIERYEEDHFQIDRPDPKQDVNDLATAEIPGQLHFTVMTSSRTRWRRILSGGELS